MRYFRCRKMDKVYKYAKKEALESLDKNEARKIKKYMLIRKCFSFLLILSSVIALILLIILNNVEASNDLIILGKIIANIALICGDVAFFGFCIYIVCKFRYELKITRYHIGCASRVLRDYYGLSDDYLITKCFSSNNSNFNNHDICIYRYGKNLRITSDIVNGYYNYSSDLGCYSLSFDELEVYKDDYNNKRVTVLKFGKYEFIIGIKAYSYIVKQRNVKVYKYFKNSIELDNKSIKFIKKLDKRIIMFKDIKYFRLSIPKYYGIMGSLYNYNSEFYIEDNMNNVYRYSFILEHSEQKELAKILTDNNVNLEVKHIDNKNYGD